MPTQLVTAVAGLLALVLLGLHSNAAAQTLRPESDLRGAWIVTVDGEPETRTLIISEVAPTAGGALLAAKYGMTKKGQSAIEAKVGRVGELRQLNLVTQAATVVLATEQPDGSFVGTFSLKSGVVKNVTIARASTSQSAPAASPPKDLTAIVPLASDIPAECAAFHGAWSGTWAQGGFAQQYLRVLEVTKKEGGCVFRLSYSSSNDPVAGKLLVDLQPGSTLSFICNRSTGGTCIFKRVASDLWASYSNPAGGSNSAVFRPAPQ